jgi:hypothetical protein
VSTENNKKDLSKKLLKNGIRDRPTGLLKTHFRVCDVSEAEDQTK